MRAMIDAKVKGQGPVVEGTKPETDSNVVDFMAALRASLLGGTQRPAKAAAVPAVVDSTRQTARPGKQPKDSMTAESHKHSGFKLPIKGGKARTDMKVEVAPAARGRLMPSGDSRRKAS